MTQRYTVKDVVAMAKLLRDEAVEMYLVHETSEFHVHKGSATNGLSYYVSFDAPGALPVPFIDLHGVTSAREAYMLLRAQWNVLRHMTISD